MIITLYQVILLVFISLFVGFILGVIAPNK